MNETKQRSTTYWVRWFTMLPALLGAVLVGFSLIFYATPIKVFYVWHQAAVGFFFAVSWMLLSYALAPDYKMTACLALLVAGASLAWLLLGQTDWPDYSGVTRVHTYVTWLGGLIGFGIVWRIDSNKKKPNQALQSIFQPCGSKKLWPQSFGQNNMNSKWNRARAWGGISLGTLWILAVGYFGLDHVRLAAGVVSAQSNSILAAQYSATLEIMKNLVVGSLAISLVLIAMSIRVLMLSRKPNDNAEPGQSC